MSLGTCSAFTTTDIVPYPNGGRLSYSPTRSLLLADRADGDNVWRLVSYDPDGSNLTELNVTHADLPANAHRGNPHWSPDGNWFIFQAATYVEHLGDTPGFSSPGLGLANDIYVAKWPELTVTRLTNIVTGAAGVLHPHYNHDGTRIWWSRKMAGRSGRWFLESADIAYPGGVPTLSNRKLHLPLGDGLYETHAFGPTGVQALFSHTAAGTTSVPGLNLYRCNAGDFYTNLVAVENDHDPDTYWHEHGHIMPDGSMLFFMGSRNSAFDPWTNLQSDIYRIDNTTPPTGLATQITRTMDDGDGTYQGDVTHPVCGDISFKNNDALYVYIFHNGPTPAEYAGLTTRPGKIVLLECA